MSLFILFSSSLFLICCYYYGINLVLRFFPCLFVISLQPCSVSGYKPGISLQPKAPMLCKPKPMGRQPIQPQQTQTPGKNQPQQTQKLNPETKHRPIHIHGKIISFHHCCYHSKELSLSQQRITIFFEAEGALRARFLPNLFARQPIHRKPQPLHFSHKPNTANPYTANPNPCSVSPPDVIFLLCC
jgi:hypothetical protein